MIFAPERPFRPAVSASLTGVHVKADIQVPILPEVESISRKMGTPNVLDYPEKYKKSYHTYLNDL
jgi:hypothetical protein